ncbi:CoA transferase [Micromonospora yasonensis]|uniref:CaiB/BaiF CoA transferase family protein n=1 Tax=Micromonospora yasonensis TaxID=1128667 RepID=UPI00222E16FA|nr:CoA transferase [Micromonospora yasonensis]MCW3841482.1 CoA transferase [Micromonospora yasonensis]
MAERGPLAGVRVLESSLLEPAALGMTLAELGADVIKVEPPGGDYVRTMAWPIIEGVSLLHWHVNRGKRSVGIDLRTSTGVDLYLDLVERSEVVIEAMRPGALARRGITVQRMRERNPALVVCSVSGWGMTGPYRDVPAHGIGFDAWAGLAAPAVDDEGFVNLPPHTTVGVRVTPVWGALAVCAALLRARATGVGAHIDLAQSDVAAATNWYAIEGTRAYERPATEVTGNPSDGGARRAPGVAGMAGSVRYQYYRSMDGHVLLMASEREFWRNFCRAVGRSDLFEANPGEQYADHARGNRTLRQELQAIFETRTTAAWVRLGAEANCPIAAVNDAASIATDPQFRARLPWSPAEEGGAELMPGPIRLVDEEPVPLRAAPGAGEHTDEVLRSVLGMAGARIADLRAAGVVDGPVPPAEPDAEG